MNRSAQVLYNAYRMTLKINNVEVLVVDKNPDDHVRASVAKHLGIGEDYITSLKIRKKSLDARRKGRIVYHYQVEAQVVDEDAVLRSAPAQTEKIDASKPVDPVEDLMLRSGQTFRHKPIIIGSGPAGTFAALTLAKAGQASILVERGEPVEKRLRTVNSFRRSGTFSSSSNYCFGEGGAGTFSDGKLTCGRNHPLVQFLFEQWVEFGAPSEILYDAHPHIGTDFLMTIAQRMRKYLEERGCAFLFGAQWVDWRESARANARYEVVLADGRVLETDHLIIAIGHSARDSYHMLLERGLAMVPKPFAIGARIEHPQEQIDRIQFGQCALLPPAEYKLVAHVGDDRGIWTFCMCPGGHLLPTNAQPEHLAINGMSYHARNSGFANAAVVVNVRREDYFKGHVLDGVYFQEAIERKAFIEGGRNYFSPAQRLKDFIAGRQSTGELESTYKPGVQSARLDRILPDFVVDSLRSAMRDYDKKMHGYISDKAIVAGVETKTSSPILMTRDKESLMSTSHSHVFPAGEGAGYAGGIVSAGLDGVRVGRAVLQSFFANALT